MGIKTKLLQNMNRGNKKVNVIKDLINSAQSVHGERHDTFGPPLTIPETPEQLD